MTALRLVALVAVAALGLAPASAQRTPPRRSSAVPAAQSTAADTLRYSVRSGEALIVALPPRARGEDASYSLLEGPALSWLVDRSFLWRTVEGERGVLPVTFQRRTASGREDTLVLLVDVTD